MLVKTYFIKTFKSLFLTCNYCIHPLTKSVRNTSITVSVSSSTRTVPPITHSTFRHSLCYPHYHLHHSISPSPFLSTSFPPANTSHCSLQLSITISLKNYLYLATSQLLCSSSSLPCPSPVLHPVPCSLTLLFPFFTLYLHSLLPLSPPTKPLTPPFQSLCCSIYTIFPLQTPLLYIPLLTLSCHSVPLFTLLPPFLQLLTLCPCLPPLTCLYYSLASPKLSPAPSVWYLPQSLSFYLPTPRGQQVHLLV